MGGEKPCLCPRLGECWACTIWATARGLGVWRPEVLVKAVEPVKTEKVDPDLFRGLDANATS